LGIIFFYGTRINVTILGQGLKGRKVLREGYIILGYSKVPKGTLGEGFPGW